MPAIYTDREEDKYTVPKKLLEEVINELEYRDMKPYYDGERGGDADYVDISSTYFDTPDLKFLKQHLAGDENRMKVRLRSYAPGGKLQDDKYLEVKYRVDGVKKKARVCVCPSDLAFAIGGESLPKSNRKRNKDLSDEEYKESCDKIKEACSGGLSPCLQVTYTRLCYILGEKLKVTIDRDIEATSFANLKQASIPDSEELDKIGGQYKPSRDVLVEIKYPIGEEVPKWLQKMIENDSSGIEVSFSKYAWGIHSEK